MSEPDDIASPSPSLPPPAAAPPPPPTTPPPTTPLVTSPLVGPGAGAATGSTLQSVRGRRIAAALIDLIPLTILSLGFAERTTDNGFFVSLEGGRFVLVAVLALAYWFVAEAITGATLGKWLLRLRVVGTDRRRASTGAVAVRTVLRVVDGLPVLYLVGLITMLASSQRQRVGDMAAKTLVVDVSDVAAAAESAPPATTSPDDPAATTAVAGDPTGSPAWYLPLLVVLAVAVGGLGIVAWNQAEPSGEVYGFDLDDEIRPFAVALADGPFSELDAAAIEAVMLPPYREGGRIEQVITELEPLLGEVIELELFDDQIVRDFPVAELGRSFDTAEFLFQAEYEHGVGTLFLSVTASDGELVVLGWTYNCGTCPTGSA